LIRTCRILYVHAQLFCYWRSIGSRSGATLQFEWIDSVALVSRSLVLCAARNPFRSGGMSGEHPGEGSAGERLHDIQVDIEGDTSSGICQPIESSFTSVLIIGRALPSVRAGVASALNSRVREAMRIKPAEQFRFYRLVTDASVDVQLLTSESVDRATPWESRTLDTGKAPSSTAGPAGR